MRFALYLWRKTKLHKAWPKCQWTENRASMQLLWTIELDRTESMRYDFGSPVVAVGMSELSYQKKDKRYGMIYGLLWKRSGRFIINFYEWFSHIISSFTCHFIIWPDTTPNRWRQALQSLTTHFTIVAKDGPFWLRIVTSHERELIALWRRRFSPLNIICNYPSPATRYHVRKYSPYNRWLDQTTRKYRLVVSNWALGFCPYLGNLHGKTLALINLLISRPKSVLWGA